MEYIVDFQGFEASNGKFVVKELAILKLGGEKPLQFFFQPPLGWFDSPTRVRLENLLSKKAYLGWLGPAEDLPYEELDKILKKNLSNASVIYVKDTHRAIWLRPFVSNVKEIDSRFGFKLFKKSSNSRIFLQISIQTY